MNAVRLSLVCVVSTAAVGTVIWMAMPAAKPPVLPNPANWKTLPPMVPLRPYVGPTIIDTHPTGSLDAELYPDKDALFYLSPRR